MEARGHRDDAAGSSAPTTQVQRGNHMQQLQQQEDREDLAVDGLNHGHPGESQPCLIEGEEPASAPPSQFVAPCRGAEAAIELAEHLDETPVQGEVAAGPPTPLSVRLVPLGCPSVAVSTDCGGDAGVCGDETVTVSARVHGRNRSSLASPFPIVPPLSLDTESGEQTPRRRKQEESFASANAGRSPEEPCEGRESPLQTFVHVGEGGPTAASDAKGEAENEAMEVIEEVGKEKEIEGGEHSENEDSKRDGGDVSGSGDYCCAGGDVDQEVLDDALDIGSGSNEAGEILTLSTDIPATSGVSGGCKRGDELADTASHSADKIEPDTPSRGKGTPVTEVEEPRPEATAAVAAAATVVIAKETSKGLRSALLSPDLLSPASEPSKCPELVLERFSGGGIGDYRDVDSDDDPDGDLSDNSRIDSDDGTALTSGSVRGGASEEAPPRSPVALSSEPPTSSLAATDGFGSGGGGVSGDGGGESPCLAGVVLKAEAPQVSSSLQIEPVTMRSRRMELSLVDNVLTRRDWPDGMSPLTSPAVEREPSRDDRVAFACSDDNAAAVVSSCTVDTGLATEGEQQVDMVAVVGGVDDGEKEEDLDPRSVVKGAPATVATASLGADDNDQSAERAGDVMRASEGENDSVTAPQTVSPPGPTNMDAGDGEPRADASNDTLPSRFVHEATKGETGSGQESPPHEDSSCLRQVSSSDAATCPDSSDGGGERCGSEVPKASASETHGTCSRGKSCDDDDDGAVTVIRMVGDDPTKKYFIPETAKVRVGARVQWVLGGGTGSVSETFHVRNGCPIIKNGWVTECSFSLSASQSRFTHTFQHAGTFVVSSITLPSEDDSKRGEIVVENTSTQSRSDSDSFESADNATSTLPDDDFHDVAILADTAATHGGAGKPVMGRLAPSMVGVSRTSAALLGAHSKADSGDETHDLDGRGGGRKSDNYRSLDNTDLDDTRATHSCGVSVVESGRSDGSEWVGDAPEASSSKTKKKKSKKKKKRRAGGDAGGSSDSRGGVEKGGVDGGTGGTGSKGLSVHRDCGFDASKVEGGIEDDPALLINELEFLSRYPDRVAGMKGGGGKSQGKTLIVGGQGFTPSKPMVVPAGAAVFIKAASVWPYGGGGQERVLSIGLHIVRTTKKPGVYTLVDNHSSKRLKVTVTERPDEPLQSDSSSVARLHPPAPEKRDKDGRSRAGSRQNAERSSSAEANSTGGGEVLTSYPRSKKNKGKEKSGAVPASTTSTAATLAGNAASASTTESLIHAEEDESIPVADVARGAEASAGVPTAPSPLPLLPPIRVKQGGDGLTLDELAEHSALHGVHVVNVSHRRGFEPAALEVGFAPGLGACVMCDLDSQQRVTREVVCRRLVGREGKSSKEVGSRSVVGGLGDVSIGHGAIRGNEGAEDDAGEDEDDPNVKSARLGPGILNKCYFMLGRYGDYRISYRGDASRGVSVVVRLPLSSSEGGGSEDVMRASTSELEVSREGDAWPLSSDVVGASEESRRCDSAAAASSDEENSAVLSGPAATATESDEPQVGCATDASSSKPIEGGHELENSSAAAGAAAGGRFSLGSAPVDWDDGQGGFVHQRAQMKKKSRRLKRNTAAAALAVASAQEANRKEAKAAAAEPRRGAVAESTGGDQAAAASAIPRDTGTSSVSRASTHLRRDQSACATASSQGATGDDDNVVLMGSSLNRVRPPTSASRGVGISVNAADAETDGSEAAAASAGSAITDKPTSFGNPEVAPGDVESTSARPAQIGACKTRKKSDSRNLDSIDRDTSSVTPAPTPPPPPRHQQQHQGPQRTVEVGKQKKGKLVRGDLSGETSGDAAPRALTPPVLAAAGAGEEEKHKPQAASGPAGAARAAAATGRGDSSMGAWRSDTKGAASYSQQYGGSTSAGNLPRASALDSGWSRTNQSHGTSVSGRWGNPPATVFAQPRPPQRILKGRGGEGERTASFGPRADDPATGGGSVGGPVSARPSTIVVDSEEHELAGVGGESLSACGGPESIETPAVLPPAGATTTTAGRVPPGRVSSRTDTCRSRPFVSEDDCPSFSPKGRSTADMCRGALATSEAPVAVDKEGLPRPHSVLGQAAATGVQSVGSGNGGGGKANVGTHESACSSLSTDVVEGGRSWANVSASNPSDVASVGSTSSTRASNFGAASTNTLNKKQKKKAKAAERKAAMRKAAAAAKSGAAAASLAEESMLKPSAKMQVSPPAEADRSSTKQRHPVVVTSEVVTAGSHVDVHEAGAGSSNGGGSGSGGGGGGVAEATTAASPSTSFRNRTTLETVTTGNVDSATGPTSLSSSDEGGVARVSSMPGLASSGWTHAVREGRGGADEKGTGGAGAPNPAGHAAGDDGDGAGAGGVLSEGPNRPPPPPKLAITVTEESSAAMVEATSLPAAATPTQAQAFQWLPPGFGGDRLCDEAHPSAANVEEGTTKRASCTPTGAPPGFDGDHLRDVAHPLAGTAAGGGMKPATCPPTGASTTPTDIPKAAAAAAGTLATAALTSNPTGGLGQNSARQGGGGGFGNCSTKISLEERSRRNRALSAGTSPFFPARYGHRGRRGYRTAQQAKPAQFPEESRLPGGGYFVEEGPNDTLPPPSAFEMQEAAHMMKVYNDMMERLRTTGMDETLPNGFTPRIYDFTDGGC
ncbi:unnamed protein product [Ectocarpus sp. CCAP 1310/34]|nr:unnamed protein product [Ectocarpus sp. CCAP 1310/34]